ncbi:MAG: chemotaxis protein CheW [Nitrococcus sp.]|nr:chemotaxis protein CheW [Nitrococcus sp.]
MPAPDSAVAAWAYPEFQAQLFKVGRLRLALPVSKLHAVVPWCDGIQVQPDQPTWCHGLLSYQGREVRVIDTATLVLPADRTTLKGHDHEGFILIAGDGCWGLACHEVEEVVPLTWEEVKWRSERGRRRWLAGTVLEQMCAVLDIDALADLVGNGSSRGP